jgi:hypothetical protein
MRGCAASCTSVCEVAHRVRDKLNQAPNIGSVISFSSLRFPNKPDISPMPGSLVGGTKNFDHGEIELSVALRV